MSEPLESMTVKAEAIIRRPPNDRHVFCLKSAQTPSKGELRTVSGHMFTCLISAMSEIVRSLQFFVLV